MTRTASTGGVGYTDLDFDPPIVARLVQPLLALRASLGNGSGAPDPATVTALSRATSQAAGTEAPHRDGIHALESSWSSNAADAAVPALRTTQTQIGDISDRGPAYLAVLTAAHTTSARAASRVDQIIADFRRDARTILDSAHSAPDTDAVITRATQALRDAITTVQSAQTEMDGHTRALDAMGPLTVTNPTGTSTVGYQSGYQSGSGPGYQYGSSGPGYQYGGPDPSYQYNGSNSYQYGQNSVTPAQYYSGPPMDPAQAAQMQLQQNLIAAGVQVGTAAISAGVDIGTHLIDKIAEVGSHAMDVVAGEVDKALPELIHPGSTTNGAGTGNASTGGSGANGKPIIDFGGGASSPVTPPATGQGPLAGSGGYGPDDPPASSGGGSNSTAVQPEPRVSSPGPARSAAPESAPAPGPTGGVAMPPPGGSGGGQDHKSRDGQLGVTTPAEAVMVPAAVIGDFGDDAI
ncbi:hypothetical protein [Nocardia sp. BMG111209]|uniref:hypothetical protein n=1 Tax=Nocardia sp. BMG111209 TaxID=1160137 RepID=UPI0003A84B51|nr:hypothetical protein [Nocardia sp. BMG111209]